MTKVTDSIGLNFERFIENNFSDLIKINNGFNKPDFYNPNLNFWIETKIGNVGWGPRIKDYQMESFDNCDGNVIYALGFHNFDKAHKNLKQKTEAGRQKYLNKNLQILDVYFLDHDLIKKIWDKEWRISENGNTTYCMVKKSMINNILTNRNFKRNGNSVESADKFYGYDLENLLIEDLGNKDVTNYGIILNKNNVEFIDYLRDNVRKD